MTQILTHSFLTTFCSAFFCIGSISVFAYDGADFPQIDYVLQEINVNRGRVELADVIDPKYESDSYYLQRIYQGSCYHYLLGCSDDGEIIQLKDASKWEVKYRGRQKVLGWASDDEIFIKPCASCFSSYRYVLYNRTLNQAIEANLKSGPLPMGALTLKVRNIDPYHRLILLNDNTIWRLESDFDLAHWQLGQRVIVGLNNKWRTEPYPQILINVELCDKSPYSRAIFHGRVAEY